jgi:hypothetical protein
MPLIPSSCSRSLNATSFFRFFGSRPLPPRSPCNSGNEIVGQSKLVLLRIQGLGFKDPTLWPFFAGERKSGSSRQGFESLLQGKKQPKMISQIWATFGTQIFFAFLRVYPFDVNCNYCYGSFLWNLGIRIRKIRIGFKSFF